MSLKSKNRKKNLASNKKKSSSAKRSSIRIKKRSKKEPETMESLLKEYGHRFPLLTQGQTVKGVVVEKLPRRVIIDIGAKSEGVVAERAYELAEDYVRELKVGDKVEAQVLVPESREGYTILSLKQSAQDRAWQRMREAKKTGHAFEVFGKSANSSGVTVKAGSLFGFIPHSQLGREASRNPKSLVDRRILVKAMDVDRDLNRLVLSEKAVSESRDFEEAKKILDGINEGQVYEGKVITVADFGCFVKLSIPSKKKGKASTKRKKVQVEGLVHVSELSWGRVETPADIVSVGDRVKVKVLSKKDNKLSLSIKQAMEDPWEKAEKKYKKDTKYKGRVVRISDFGVFVELEPGIEGLIHMTKIPPGMKFKRGQDVNVYIEDMDIKSERLSLQLVHVTKPVGYK